MASIHTANTELPNAPLSGWSLFWQLARGRIVPGQAWNNPAYRRKFVIRSLLTPIKTFRYLTRLARNPWLEALLHAQPGLPCKLHRPWLTAATSLSHKQAGISQHYDQFCHALPASVVSGCFSSHPVLLARLTGKGDETFRIRLLSDPDLDKEGEATLIFLNAQNTVLASITFTLLIVNNKPTLFIGGLQGAKSNVAHEAIQTATKACHGLFPKRLLTEAVMTIGFALAIEQIIAVGNKTHIYASWRYRRKKKDKFRADYDEFWLSLGGEPLADGNFRLPSGVSRKSMEEIASKKRAEYRRRYELLDGMVNDIIAVCSNHGS